MPAGAIALVALAGLLAGCGNADDTAAATTQATSAPAGNGIEALDADQILAKAKAALKGAKSFRMTGTSDNNGQKMAVDLEVSGDDLRGTLSLGTGKLELLAVGGTRYVRPDEAFWMSSAPSPEQGKAAAEAVGNRWISSRNDQQFDSNRPQPRLTPATPGAVALAGATYRDDMTALLVIVGILLLAGACVAGVLVVRRRRRPRSSAQRRAAALAAAKAIRKGSGRYGGAARDGSRQSAVDRSMLDIYTAAKHQLRHDPDGGHHSSGSDSGGFDSGGGHHSGGF